ncbi:MAG TPA: MOSC domain-containing protein [Thermoanaerobaculia bacterium]|nr:MOSC domain-containing protein [Thermoanaerobaculia bacterium]
MRLLSIQVGRPRIVRVRDGEVATGIYKDPAAGPVRVGFLNLAGDGQADLSVHGGRNKAVYAYPAEHYPLWREELPEVDLPFGAFGENLTTEGLLESEVRIGDRYRIGSVELRVTQPRLPCYKLALRLARPDIGRRLLKSGRTGLYFAVLREGTIEAGDAIELLERPATSITVQEAAGLATGFLKNPDALRRALVAPALPASWREEIRHRAGA